MSDRRAIVVGFRCPKCGSEFLCGEQDKLTLHPTRCSFGHSPTEMEAMYLGEAAYRRADASDLLRLIERENEGEEPSS